MDNVVVTAISLSSLSSLSALLLISGVAKLLFPVTGSSLVTSLPTPFAARWLQGLLPWLELVLAIAFLLASGVILWAAASATTVLFSVFTAAVLRGTRHQVSEPCGCFGSLSRAPVSRRTVVRNLAFTLVAVLALALVTVGGYHGPVLDLPWWLTVAVAIPVLLILVALWSERAAAPLAGDPRTVEGIPPLPDLRHDHAATSLVFARPASAAPHPVSVIPGEDEYPDAAGSSSAVSSRAGVTPGAVTTTTSRRTVPGGDASPGAVTEPRSTDGLSIPEESEEYVRLPIPQAHLSKADGTAVTPRGLAATAARTLVHVGSADQPCAPVLERLAGMSEHVGPVAVHAVVARERDRELLPSILRPACLVDGTDELSTAFEHPGHPWIVVLGADGLLAGGPDTGTDAVLEMLSDLEARFAD